MLKIGDFETDALHKEKEKQNLQQQLDASRLEISDLISSFARDSGASGDSSSSAEVSALRDALDAAQEEVVVASEKCEGLTSEIKLLEQKLAIFEQLVAASSSASSLPDQPSHPPASIHEEPEVHVTVSVGFKQAFSKVSNVSCFLCSLYGLF